MVLPLLLGIPAAIAGGFGLFKASEYVGRETRKGWDAFWTKAEETPARVVEKTTGAVTSGMREIAETFAESFSGFGKIDIQLKGLENLVPQMPSIPQLPTEFKLPTTQIITLPSGAAPVQQLAGDNTTMILLIAMGIVVLGVVGK